MMLLEWFSNITPLTLDLPFIAAGTEVSLALPPVLFLLVLPLVAKILPRLKSRRGRALLVPAGGTFHGLGDDNATASSFKGLKFLAWLIWILLVLSAARPLWLGQPVSSPVSGRDLMIAIDISGSMNESDIYSGNRAFSRIDVVRQVAGEFVERRAGDRLGLIMFGSQAYLQTPLTFDHKTVAHFLREAQVGLAGRSTAIGDAIGLGVKRLRDRPQEARVMILLTDGSNTAGVVQPLDAARVAAESGIKIHTIGVGSEGGRSMLGFPMSRQRSDLDEKTLIKIAEMTGGEYFRARDAAELVNIYTIIDKLEPTDSEADQYRPQIELFPWPLAMSLLLSALLAWRWDSRYPFRGELS